MQVGDQVKLVGTVKDMVTDKGSGRVSVLLDTLESPGHPSKEYWAQESDLVADTPAAAGAEAASAASATPAEGHEAHKTPAPAKK